MAQENLARELGAITTSLGYIKEKVDDTHDKVINLSNATASQETRLEEHGNRISAIENNCKEVQASKTKHVEPFYIRYRNAIAGTTLVAGSIAAGSAP